jgi:DNA helicase-2/ATP-dependent DNA helicase PcrA
MLVIVHRMAANRLGFDKLYSALNDDAPDSFKTGVIEGTLWALKPFLDVVLPLVEAFKTNDEFKTIGLLRIHSPRLRMENWEKAGKPAELLLALKSDVSKLTELLAPDHTASILEVLQFIKDSKLIELDPRFDEHLQVETAAVEQKSEMLSMEKENGAEIDSYDKVMSAYLACPVSQIWGYRTYIEDRSPYSTQHGIKGDEFERVLVVLDDEEATYNLYSYEKLLGIQAPSDTDIKNQKEGKDSVFDRTRRLFYVCCSRAVKDLAVVLFTPNVAKAIQVIKAGNMFEADCVKSIADLPEK